jgi:hypothetical protein
VPRAGIKPTPRIDYRPVSQTRQPRRKPLGHHVPLIGAYWLLREAVYNISADQIAKHSSNKINQSFNQSNNLFNQPEHVAISVAFLTADQKVWDLIPNSGQNKVRLFSLSILA